MSKKQAIEGNLDCCSTVSFVSYSTGDNLMNLVIISHHLVNMTSTIMLFYRPVPFSGAFVVDSRERFS